MLESCLIGGGLCIGMVATLLVIDIVRGVRGRADRRPPVTRGQLHLFDDDGDHFLSAKLPVTALQKLLEDFNRGRLR